MQLYYDDPMPRQGKTIEDIPSTFGGVLGGYAEEAWETNPMMSAARAFQLGAAKMRTGGVSKEEATRRATEGGFPEAIADMPDTSVSESWLALQEELARSRRTRQSAIERGEGGLLEAAGGFAVSIGVSIVDPINVASAFVPVVGPMRYSIALERAATRGARAALRAKKGAIEGAAGAVMVEPLVLAGQYAQYADYGMVDALLNMAVGSVMGGGLHMGVGALADRHRIISPKTGEVDPQSGTHASRSSQPTGVTANRMAGHTPEVREAAIRTAIAQGADGYINVESLLRVVETVDSARVVSPENQRASFVSERLGQLERWVSGQDKKTAKGVRTAAETAQRAIGDTDARVKTKTKALQNDKVKFKEAKKQATEFVEAENVKHRAAIKRAADDIETGSSRVEQVKREIAQLKQGSIPQRMLSLLKQHEPPIVGGAKARAMAVRNELHTLKRDAERPDNMLLGEPDKHVPLSRQLDDSPEYNGPEDIQRDIDDLELQNPDVDTKALDERIAEIETERQAIEVLARCRLAA